MRSAVPNGVVICALACDPLIADERQAAGRNLRPAASRSALAALTKAWHDQLLKKRKQKKQNARSAVHLPDEEFSAGPLNMARVGRHVVSEINGLPGELEKFQDHLVEGYAEVVRDIDREIESAGAMVSKLDPLSMLHRAWCERSAATLGWRARSKSGRSTPMRQG